jgi:hypothetical protein
MVSVQRIFLHVAAINNRHALMDWLIVLVVVAQKILLCAHLDLTALPEKNFALMVAAKRVVQRRLQKPSVQLIWSNALQMARGLAVLLIWHNARKHDDVLLISQSFAGIIVVLTPPQIVLLTPVILNASFAPMDLGK